MKKGKNNIIIWAVVALVVGILIGFLINNVTTGEAIKSISKQSTINLKSSTTNNINGIIQCHCNKNSYHINYTGDAANIWLFCAGVCAAKDEHLDSLWVN